MPNVHYTPRARVLKDRSLGSSGDGSASGDVVAVKVTKINAIKYSSQEHDKKW